jgi:hypothetical protein
MKFNIYVLTREGKIRLFGFTKDSSEALRWAYAASGSFVQASFVG